MRYLKKSDRKCGKPQDSRTKEKDNEERRQNPTSYPGPFASMADGRRKWSISSTRRKLRDAGHIGHKSRKKPRLTSRHKKARLNFARTHKIVQLNSGPKPFLVMSPDFVCIGVMEECMLAGW